MLKRIRTPSWLMALVLSTSALGAAPELTIGESSGEPGATVELDVRLEQSTDVVGLQFDLTYDPESLAALGPLPGADLGDHLLDGREVAAGHYRLIAVSPTHSPLEAAVARLPFQISGAAEPGEVPIQVTAALLGDDLAAAVAPGELVDGRIEVLPSQPPQVARVGSVAATREGELRPGEHTMTAITQLLVSYNEPIDDPPGDDGEHDVTHPASYRVYAVERTAPDLPAECAPTPPPGHQPIVVDRVTYDLESRTASLRLQSAASLPLGRYRLQVCSTLVDLSGTALDGDRDGVAGDAYSIEFAVEASNLLHNPNLDDDLAGWILDSPLPQEIEHLAEDADAEAGSGSARVQPLSGPDEVYRLTQCVPVVGGELHRIGGRARSRSWAPGASVAAAVETYALPECQEPLLDVAVAPMILAGTGDAWTPEISSTLTVPPAAVSARVSFLVDPSWAPDLEAHLDSLFFSLQTLIFSDDFETGDSTRWSISMPPLP